MGLTVTQAWLLIGVPVVVASLALYTARSRAVGAAGLLLLLAGTVALTSVDRASGAVLAVLLTLLYATGRAGAGIVRGADPVRARRQAGVPGDGDRYPRST